MVPSLVLRSRPVLYRLFLLLSVLITATTLRAQITVPTTGGGLSLAVNPITNKIYIPSRGSLGAVTVIDGATNTTKILTAGTNPSMAAVDPVINKIYVTDQPANDLIVIDGGSDTVTATLPTGNGPLALAVNPVTHKVYVANIGTPNGGNTVTVIDGTTNTVLTNLTVGTSPYAVAINPVTNKIYIANNGSPNVTVIDGASDTVTATVTLQALTTGVAVNPVTNKVYALSAGFPGFVTVIDGATNTITGNTIPVGSASSMVALNPVTNKIYVTNFSNSPGNTVTVIDGADNTTSTLTMGGTFPYTEAVNSVTDKIYVANFTFTGGSNPDDGSVTIIDGATNTTTTVPAVGNGANTLIVGVNSVTNRVYTSIPGSVGVIDGAINAATVVPTGNFPSNAVAVNPVTNKIYIPDSDDQTVTVLDITTNAPTAESPITVGNTPAFIAVNPVTNKVYVANAGDNTVSVIDSATDTVIGAPVDVGTLPLHLAVNPVTNKIYVVNFTSDNVSVIDGASDTVIATPTVGDGPGYIAVNSATNKVYVAVTGFPTPDNTVAVIDGTSNNVTATVTVGSAPQWVAVNPVTNRIYIANSGVFGSAPGNTISVIDGTSDTVIATPTVGTYPRQIAVNPATNKIYVSNSASNDATAIDGVTNNTTRIDTSGSGTYPWGVEVNPVTNTVYVTNNLSSPGVTPGVVMIDGASNTITATVRPPSIRFAQDGVVYPAANKLYFLNAQSNDVSIIDVDGHQTVPLTTTIAGVVDPLTISTTNVFQTANSTPSFTVNVNSVFSSINPSAINPPPTAVYYEVDGGTRLRAGSNTTLSGANPASFSITLSPQQFGLHTLYVYAAYGNEGGNEANANASGNSSEIGNLTAYLFLVVPVPTTTTVTVDVNPQVQGQPVVLTAQVAPPAPTGGPDPTGTVTFSDGTTVLGTGTIAGTGLATFTSSSLSLGDHTITAAYSGDPNYGASTSAPLTVTIVNSLTTIIELVGGNDQAAVYGTAFTQPLTVVVTKSGGTPAAGVSVTFVGANLSFSPSATVTTNSSGQASVMATGVHVGDLLATATTPGVTSAVNFALTVTPATLTVTANNVSRTFGAANPAFTGTIAGAVHGDTFTFSASVLATASSPVGTYPITPSVTGPALANYTLQTVNGTLTVNKATLTVTAGNGTRLFGQPNPTLVATITGFVDGDTSAVVSGTPAISTTALTNSPAGVFPILVAQGTLFATNYNFVFVNGILTIEVVVLTPPTGPVEAGTPVTLTATVPPGATGTVTFDDGTTVLGTVTLPTTGARTGVTLVVTTLGPGMHTITAVYSGDANFPPSTSAPITLVVTPAPADFALASTTGRQLIPPGASANFTIVLSSVNQPFTNPVTMSASNLPPGGTYTFNPAAVTPGAAGASTTFTVSVPMQSSTVASRGNALGPAALALLLLPLAFLKRHRGSPPRLLLVALLALVSFLAISGCGQGGYFSQTEQTYTITVTGTSGSLVRSTTVTLTVE